jgi:hypothetical protein
MITIQLMETIYGSAWTRQQCDTVAKLHGKQLAERTAGRRAFARTLASDGDVLRTAYKLIARSV